MLSVLALAFMARRRGQRLDRLEQHLQRYLEASTQHKQANLLLLAPLKGRAPLKLLNFSEAAIHIRRIERRHTDKPEEVALVLTQDPSHALLNEKALLHSGDYAELDIFAEVPLQDIKTKSAQKQQAQREVLAKITLNIYYFYSLAGDSNQETRFAVTLYAQRAAGQESWTEQLEIKRYT